LHIVVVKVRIGYLEYLTFS
jgi:hypothetical protein